MLKSSSPHVFSEFSLEFVAEDDVGMLTSSSLHGLAVYFMPNRMNLPVFPFRAVLLWEYCRKCLANRMNAVYFPFRAVLLWENCRKCLANRMNAVLYPFREGYRGETWRKSFSKRTTRPLGSFVEERIWESLLRTTLEVYKPSICTAII